MCLKPVIIYSSVLDKGVLGNESPDRSSTTVENVWSQTEKEGSLVLTQLLWRKYTCLQVLEMVCFWFLAATISRKTVVCLGFFFSFLNPWNKAKLKKYKAVSNTLQLSRQREGSQLTTHITGMISKRNGLITAPLHLKIKSAHCSFFKTIPKKISVWWMLLVYLFF